MQKAGFLKTWLKRLSSNCRAHSKDLLVLAFSQWVVTNDWFIQYCRLSLLTGGALCPIGRVSDYGARGRGFDAYLRCVVSLSKDTFTPRKVLVIPRKRWLRPNMTEKLLTGMLSLNKTKTSQQTQVIFQLSLVSCTKTGFSKPNTVDLTDSLEI